MARLFLPGGSLGLLLYWNWTPGGGAFWTCFRRRSGPPYPFVVPVGTCLSDGFPTGGSGLLGADPGGGAGTHKWLWDGTCVNAVTGQVRWVPLKQCQTQDPMWDNQLGTMPQVQRALTLGNPAGQGSSLTVGNY